MPDVPSKTCVVIRNVYGRVCYSIEVPGRRRGHLCAWISFCALDSELRQLTASFEDLSRALGAIRQREGDNLVESREFDLSTNRVSLYRVALELR